MPPPDPYRVWMSEIMLQQTTVAAVFSYFEKFTERWPDFAALASADDADVMAAWAGLGYYSRARNLIKCARAVVTEYGGELGHVSAEREGPGTFDPDRLEDAVPELEPTVGGVDGGEASQGDLAVDPLSGIEQLACMGDLVGSENVWNGDEHGVAEA